MGRKGETAMLRHIALCSSLDFLYRRYTCGLRF
jgi:hypothetical protein